MTNVSPRPSKWLVIVSVLNIDVCLYLFSESVAGIVVGLLLLDSYVITFASSFSLLLFWFGLYTGPFWIAMATQQYRGTFRDVPSAAKMCSVVLFILGALVSVALPPSVVVVAFGALEGDFFPLLFFIPLLVTVLFLFAAGHLNATRKDQITAALASQVTLPNQRGFSLRELFLVMGIFAVISAVVGYRLRPALPEHANIPWQAEHVDISAAPFGLPSDATDISYRQGFRRELICEFTIDEAIFRDWVNTQVMPNPIEGYDMRLCEIASLETFEIRRYKDSQFISITDGLAFRYRDSRPYKGGYDRATGRAYYHRGRQ